MRILHVYRDIVCKVGVPYEAMQLAKSQAELGHEVAVLHQGRPWDDPSSFSGSNIHAIPLRGSFGCTHEIRTALQDFKPDIAHVYSLWIPAHNAWISAIRRQGIAYVAEPHGTLNPEMMKVRFGGKRNTPYHHFAKFAYRKLLDEPLLRSATGIRTLSSVEKNIADRLGLPLSFVCPCGFSPEWLQPKCTYRPPAEGEPLNVFFIGRLDVWQKGLDLTLEAFRRLKEISSPSLFKLTLVGSPLNGSDNILREQIRRLGLENVEIFGPAHGTIKQCLFQQAHLFIHPSRFEGMAKTAREAVSFGIPVLASRESNFGDWVESESMGKVIELSAENIARSLSEMRSDPRKLQNWSDNAWRFSQQWQWPAVAERIIAGYHALLAGRSFDAAS